MSTELLDALLVLESEKGISKDIIIDAIEAALISAYKRNFNQAQNVRVSFNPEVGTIQVLARKDVVDNVFDPRLEISVEEARQINPNYQDGDVLEIEVTPKDFGRIADKLQNKLSHNECVKQSAVLFTLSLVTVKKILW